MIIFLYNVIFVDACNTFDWISWAQLLVFRNSNFKKMQWTCSFNFIPSTIGRGHDRMVVELKLPMRSMSITTQSVSSYPAHGEVYLIQLYVIKFVSDVRQVGGFLRVLWFPLPIKLTAMIKLKYCWKWR
jgi:hypothetical protein